VKHVLIMVFSNRILKTQTAIVVTFWKCKATESTDTFCMKKVFV